MKRTLILLAFLATPLQAGPGDLTGTGDLGLVVERASGSVLVIDRSERAAVGRVEGLGDLSHASLTYSPDERFDNADNDLDGDTERLRLLTAYLDLDSTKARDWKLELVATGDVPITTGD